MESLVCAALRRWPRLITRRWPRGTPQGPFRPRQHCTLPQACPISSFFRFQIQDLDLRLFATVSSNCPKARGWASPSIRANGKGVESYEQTDVSRRSSSDARDGGGPTDKRCRCIGLIPSGPLRVRHDLWPVWSRTEHDGYVQGPEHESASFEYEGLWRLPDAQFGSAVCVREA